MSTWNFMNINGQCHALTFIHGHSDSTFSKFFSLETAMSVEAKFHVAPLWDEGMKVSINAVCHMTKMAMAIYDTNLKKHSSLEPKGGWPWNLVCGFSYSSTTKFVQMMTGLTLTYFTARSNFVPFVFVWERFARNLKPLRWKLVHIVK